MVKLSCIIIKLIISKSRVTHDKQMAANVNLSEMPEKVFNRLVRSPASGSSLLDVNMMS